MPDCTARLAALLFMLLLLAGCGADEETVLRSTNCDEGKPVILWGRIDMEPGRDSPAKLIARVALERGPGINTFEPVEVYRRDAPALPMRYELCGEPSSLVERSNLRVTAQFRAIDSYNSYVADQPIPADANADARVDLVLSPTWH